MKLLEGDKLPPQVSRLQGYWLLYSNGHCFGGRPISSFSGAPIASSPLLWSLQLSLESLVTGLILTLIQA